MALYDAFNIINWRVKKIGNEFRHFFGGFTRVHHGSWSIKRVPGAGRNGNYRVLRLDENNEYSIQVYSDRTGEMLAGDLIYPTISGKRLNEILFFPIGAQGEWPFNWWNPTWASGGNQSGTIETVLSTSNPYSSGEPRCSLFSWIGSDDADPLGQRTVAGSATPLRGSGKLPMLNRTDWHIAKEEAMDSKKAVYAQDLGRKIAWFRAVNKTATQFQFRLTPQITLCCRCACRTWMKLWKYCLKWCAAFYGSGSKARFTIKQDFARGRISLEGFEVLPVGSCRRSNECKNASWDHGNR